MQVPFKINSFEFIYRSFCYGEIYAQTFHCIMKYFKIEHYKHQL